MACYTYITSIANTINKLNTMSNLNSVNIHDLYHNKQESIDDLFYKYIKPLLKDIDHPALNK